MQKCATCQFYDRKQAKATAGSVAQSHQGQCRRTSPMLHPVNAKSYVVDGVWPTVQDDDWCGEWKLVARRADVRVNDVSSGAAMGGLQPTVPHVARIGANTGAEPGRTAQHIGTVLSAPVKPFMPIPATRGVTPPTAAAAEVTVAGTHSGDD